MKQILHSLLASAIAFGGLGVAGYAIAESAGANVALAPIHDEPTAEPVGGEILAKADSGVDETQAGKCIPTGEILGVLAGDAELLGGETLALTDGFQQDFSDHWRQSVGADPVNVSLVVAHVVPAQDGNAIVDVIEIGADGCALSRTLLTGEDWADLLRSARGVDV